MVQFYRAVGEAEFADISRCGKLRTVAGSLEGKWFAESFDDAFSWGRRLYGVTAFYIVTVRVRDNHANQFFRLAKLDNIGPARFVEMQDLKFVEIAGFYP